MTNEELAEIEAREKAATPGPWEAHVGEQGGDEYDDPSIAAGEQFIALTSYDGLSFTVERPAGYSREADARFIAHARADIPRLLAALKAKQAEIERLRARLRG